MTKLNVLKNHANFANSANIFTACKAVVILLIVLLSLQAKAQVCLPELQANDDRSKLEQPATTSTAVEYLRRTVRLLEPVLPAFREAVIPLANENHALYDDIVYLQKRFLLPETLQIDVGLELATWQGILRHFAAWYGISETESEDIIASISQEETLTNRHVLLQLAHFIEQAQGTFDAVALVASAQHNANQVAFWAIIRNDGVYPRLIIVRPDPQINIVKGPADVLPTLATCAIPLENYIFATEDVAKKLFLSNNQSSMIIASAEPPLTLEIPSGTELSYLNFSAPELAETTRYAALFPGPQLGAGTIFSLISSIRTNMSPGEILSFLNIR